MNSLVVVLSVCMLLSSSFVIAKESPFTQVKHVNDVINIGDDKCSMCIEFAEQTLDAFLQFILQVGVVDSCGDLCQAFADKIGNKAVGFVCSVLCDVVGVDEFVKIIDKADLDPIYYCELIPVCPVNDNGDAKFNSFSVSPTSGPQGIFLLSFEYVSQNGTGTGQIFLDLQTVDKIPIAQAFLHELAPAGTYTGSFQLKAEPDPNCDPTQGPCEQWLPGDYNVKIAICNGECGSQHPHSKIYDEATTKFTITDTH